jgi:hypothetical protein
MYADIRVIRQHCAVWQMYADVPEELNARTVSKYTSINLSKNQNNKIK